MRRPVVTPREIWSSLPGFVAVAGATEMDGPPTVVVLPKGFGFHEPMVMLVGLRLGASPAASTVGKRCGLDMGGAVGADGALEVAEVATTTRVGGGGGGAGRGGGAMKAREGEWRERISG